MTDFDVCRVGARTFIDAILKAAPNGEPVLVSFHANGDWAIYGNGRYAQPCADHEYVNLRCPDCGKPAEPTATSRG